MIVFCAGMVRSGSTLQYNIVREIAELSGGQGEGYTDHITPNSYPDHWWFDNRLHIVKTHEVTHHVIRQKFCYTYRDIRDVAASLKQKSWLPLRAYTKYIDESLRNFERAKAAGGLIIRYEDLFGDRRQSIIEHAEWLQSPITDMQIAEIETHTYISYTKATVSTLRAKLHIGRKFDPQTLRHPDHISKFGGVPGAWREVLSKRQQREMNERYKGWLGENGYS